MRPKPSPTVLELAHQTAHPGEAPHVSPHILVIDDDYIIRDLLLRILSDQYRVDTLSSGIHLANFVELHKPDLIILDIMLPWINGLDICQLLRSWEQTKDTPIIFLSAKAGEMRPAQGDNGGRHAALRKPFQKEALLTTIENLLK